MDWGSPKPSGIIFSEGGEMTRLSQTDTTEKEDDYEHPKTEHQV
jgi:hypothetical protein